MMEKDMIIRVGQVNDPVIREYLESIDILNEYDSDSCISKEEFSGKK